MDYKNCKCRKKLVDKLVEECAETIEEVKITAKNEHKINVVLAQLTLELLLILFTTNPWIVMKKMFLYMMMYIKQKIININGRSQTNRDKKSNLLFLQWHD